MVSSLRLRLFLAVWLALFALQSADVFALVAPDGCFEATEGGTDPDGCPDQSCPRCLCNARVPAPATLAVTFAVEPPVAMAPTAIISPSTSASPRGILHVPKAR